MQMLSAEKLNREPQKWIYDRNCLVTVTCMLPRKLNCVPCCRSHTAESPPSHCLLVYLTPGGWDPDEGGERSSLSLDMHSPAQCVLAKRVRWDLIN